MLPTSKIVSCTSEVKSLQIGFGSSPRLALKDPKSHQKTNVSAGDSPLKKAAAQRCKPQRKELAEKHGCPKMTRNEKEALRSLNSSHTLSLKHVVQTSASKLSRTQLGEGLCPLGKRVIP